MCCLLKNKVPGLAHVRDSHMRVAALQALQRGLQELDRAQLADLVSQSNESSIQKV
jgi:hypothetical protein